MIAEREGEGEDKERKGKDVKQKSLDRKEGESPWKVLTPRPRGRYRSTEDCGTGDEQQQG